MNYDFTGKPIKCETWEQMEHLAKLAEEQGYSEMGLTENGFNNGRVHFEVNSFFQYINLIQPQEDNVINYAMFTLPTETIEVTGCKDCPMISYSHDYDYFSCRHPNQKEQVSHYSGVKGRDKLFNTCPLKTKSITIKIKNNDTTGN